MDRDKQLIQTRDIARRHPDGQGWLLDHVSLEIPAGAAISVVGPSGSGKTLLLRALAWLDPLDAGEIRFRGEPLHSGAIPHYRSQVVYLHQRPMLLEERVEAALRRPWALRVHRKRSFDRRRIVQMLEQLGRDESFLDKPVAELSGGEFQIAALLRAVQLDPQVLLLDEPTAALDAQATEVVERLVRGWRAEAPELRATVWVTHQTDQSRRMADRVLQIEHGRVADGQ
jgi:putative ABC transport system ATP-binding protein